jgi:hypothetical protein
LRIGTVTDGPSSLKDQSIWLDLSTRGRQAEFNGGSDNPLFDPGGVVAEIPTYETMSMRLSCKDSQTRR